MSSKSNSKFDEYRWVIQIRRSLEEEIEDDDTDQVPVCIFSVPNCLMATHPDSFTPQQVAIGPYHCCRPELYEIERYKLTAAKRVQKQLTNLNFQDIVQQFTTLEPRIRACYSKYLDFNGETLSWMMAIDGSFLLEFLQVYAIREGKINLSRSLSSRMSHLVDYSGRKSTHNAILRDIVMLENQIPLFVLRKMSEFQLSSPQSADDMLLSMFLGLYKELSPFRKIENLPKIQVSECTQLLDFLYQMVTPKIESPSNYNIEIHEDQKENSSENPSNCVEQFGYEIHELFSKLKRILLSRPVKLISKLPWKILSCLPAFAILNQIPTLEYLNFSQENNPENENSRSLNNNMINRPPLLEEITIPSVTELSESGIHFLPSNGDISTTYFEPEEAKFYLPAIGLDVNTEVLLRNLVAYETSNVSGPLAFTRYAELMNGIIDSEEDVRLLRQRGIIMNHLKSDKEVAKMWNGMSKSIRLTKVGFLDRVIEDVNKYYNGRWRVKVGRFVKKNVFGSWPLLTLLAAILVLYLMALQAFCSLFGCNRFSRN